MARQRITFESAGRELHGRLFVPEQATQGSILFVHGFGARGRSCEQYAKKLVQAGITCLTFDLSGHGDSEGNVCELSFKDNLEDVCVAYDQLNDQKKNESLRVAGMSFGGNLAAMATALRPIASLLLRSPPCYPKALLDVPRSEYASEDVLVIEPEPDNPALHAIRSFAGHVSLVVSEFDEIIPTAVTDAYTQAANNCTKTILNGASHSLDAETQQQFQPVLMSWATSP